MAQAKFVNLTTPEEVDGMQAEISAELLEELRRRAREEGRPERELLDYRASEGKAR